MWIHTSGWQGNNLATLSSWSVNGWGRWCSGQWWRQHCSQLSVSVGWRCTRSLASLACRLIVCCGMLERKGSGRVALTKHSWVSFLHILHYFMPRKLNTPLLLFSDLSAMFYDQLLHFLYCGTRKPFFGHFGHVQGQAHVGLLQLYMSLLPSHRSMYVEYLQSMSSCFKEYDAAITLTIYTSVTSSIVIKACLVHSWGCLSRNLSIKIPELTTSWCSISRTVRTNALVNHEGFPLRPAIRRSCSSRRTPGVCYTVNWWQFTTVWIYSHPTACRCLFRLLPVLRTIFKCTSWVIFLVAA